MNVVLVIIFIALGGPAKDTPDLIVLRQKFPTMEACNTFGQLVVNELEKSKTFVGGVFVDCVQLATQRF